jgi:hypothetical protein
MGLDRASCGWQHPGSCSDLCVYDNAGKRIREYVHSPGATLGKTMAYSLLTHEQNLGTLDWREVALVFAQMVDRLEKQAREAMTLAPPPIVLYKPPG